MPETPDPHHWDIQWAAADLAEAMVGAPSAARVQLPGQIPVIYDTGHPSESRGLAFKRLRREGYDLRTRNPQDPFQGQVVIRNEAFDFPPPTVTGATVLSELQVLTEARKAPGLASQLGVTWIFERWQQPLGVRKAAIPEAIVEAYRSMDPKAAQEIVDSATVTDVSGQRVVVMRFEGGTAISHADKTMAPPNQGDRLILYGGIGFPAHGLVVNDDLIFYELPDSVVVSCELAADVLEQLPDSLSITRFAYASRTRQESMVPALRSWHTSEDVQLAVTVAREVVAVAQKQSDSPAAPGLST